MVPLRTVFTARLGLEFRQQQQMKVPALRLLVRGVVELTMFAQRPAAPARCPMRWT